MISLVITLGAMVITLTPCCLTLYHPCSGMDSSGTRFGMGIVLGELVLDSYELGVSLSLFTPV